MGQTSETEYSFLLTAIHQLQELKTVIDDTSNDLLENLKLENINQTDKIVRKVYNRLEITCKLGSDKIQEILNNLKTDYTKYTKEKSENQTVLQKRKSIDTSSIVEIDMESSTSAERNDTDIVPDNNTAEKNPNIDDENSSGVKCQPDVVEDKVKLKLVAIETLMDPKLLINRPEKNISVSKNINNYKKLKEILCSPSNDNSDEFVSISERKGVRNVKKLMDLSIICLDDSTDESSSDYVVAIAPKKSNSVSKTTEKTENISNNNTTISELLAKCQPVKVKINKLPKNLENLMKKNGVTEIRNNRNKVIAQLPAKTEQNNTSDEVESRKKRNRRSSSASSSSQERHFTSKNSKKQRKNEVTPDKIDKSQNNSSSNSQNAIKIHDKKNKKDSIDNIEGTVNESEKAGETEKSSKKCTTNGNGNGTPSDSEHRDDGGDGHDETRNSDTSEKSNKSNKKLCNGQLKKKTVTPLEKSSTNTKDDKSKSSRGVDDVESENGGKVIDTESNNTKINNSNGNEDDSEKEELGHDKKKELKKSSKKDASSVGDKSDNESEGNKNGVNEKSNSSDTENEAILKRRSSRRATTATSSDDFRENSRPRRNSAKPPVKVAFIDDEASDDNGNDVNGNNTNTDDDDVNRDNKKTVKSNTAHQKSDRASSDSDVFQPTSKKRKNLKDQNDSDKLIKGENSSSDQNDDDSDNEKPKKRKRIKRVKDSDSSDDEDDEDDDDDKNNKGRKNIRKLLKEKDLKDETKKAARTEMERKKRIEERQRLYNKIYEEQIKKVKTIDKLVLDFDEETKEDLLTVDKKLIRKLKPHQASGVKFMWDACFETIKQSSDGSGSGCILAHCMGLGKSLQIVTLVHTLLTNSDTTNVQRVLIIAPLSTVLNWVNEFEKWLKFCDENNDIEIYEISKYKKNIERAYKLNEWHEGGGVLILGYDMFRNLANETGSKMRKKTREQIQTSLIDPGPDMVVCDEGHLLKNEKTTLSKVVNRIKTLRRIVLTGTPLQNNLKEYYCMVQFVKPNLLGKFTEYMNRFVNPITNGQYTDSTLADIQLMKKRSHVLHKMLDGCVQRRDYAVLAPFLPPKHEYVVFVQLTELQVKLYKYYMENKSGRIDPTQKRSSILFADFQNLQRVWTHPRVLRYNSDKYELVQQKKRDCDSEDDFIADNTTEESEAGSSSSSDSSESEGSNYSDQKSKPSVIRKTRRNADQIDSDSVEEEKIENPTEWWTTMVTDDDLDSLKNSGKLMLLFAILKECESLGDKLLVFSQSLYSLDVIEHFLKLIHEKRNDKDDDCDENDNICGYKGSWKAGADYFRLDGSTSIESRNSACKIFNNTNNVRARLFLISTRAGGLGINLVSANRVVIFDVSWNPSHDIQSIFRVYRFGQTKPCYIYRFIALGSMEEKIYERQVTKLAISKRVIDEQQIDRHYKENDLMELYRYEIEPEEQRPTPLVPKDRLFADLLIKHEQTIFKYHEHDSLLENKEEETLNEDERKAAWDEFEAEKNRPQYTYAAPRSGPVTSNFIFGFRTDILLRLLNIKSRKDNPMFTDNEVRQMVPLLLQKLHSQMEIGDGTLYKELVNLQNELEIPSVTYSPMMSQMGIQAGLVNAFANQGMGLSGTTNPLLNPYSAATSSVLQLRAQHQQLEQYAIEQQQKMIQEQAKARLLELERSIAAASMHTEVIDLD